MDTVAWWEARPIGQDGEPAVSMCLGCAIQVDQSEFRIDYSELPYDDDVVPDEGLDCEVCGTPIFPPRNQLDG